MKNAAAYNALAAFIIAGYLVMVIWQGNALNLVNDLKQEKEFIKWGVALVILGLIKDSGIGGPIPGALIAVSFVGMLLNVGNNSSQIFTSIKTLWSKL